MSLTRDNITINKTSLSTGGVAQDLVADGAGNYGLGVAKDGGNVEAAYMTQGLINMARHSNILGHLTSMKKELGPCTRRFFLCMRFWVAGRGFSKSTTN